MDEKEGSSYFCSPDPENAVIGIECGSVGVKLELVNVERARLERWAMVGCIRIKLDTENQGDEKTDGQGYSCHSGKYWCTAEILELLLRFTGITLGMKSSQLELYYGIGATHSDTIVRKGQQLSVNADPISPVGFKLKQ